MSDEPREYVALTRPTLDAVESALHGSFSLGQISSRDTELTFYDTFDGLLHGAGVTVALTPGGTIPDSARALAGNRALLPLASVRVRVASAPLLDELEKTVVRLELLSPDGLAPRLVLHGLRGYGAELAEVIEALDLPEAQLTLRDEAIMAAGGRPGGVSAKIAVTLAAQDRAEDAVIAVLSALWEVIEANLDGTLADTDVEFLHDYRVTVRKTRSVLKEFPGVFTPPLRERWRTEFRWLQQITGDTRDLDVSLEDWDELIGLVSEADRRALAPLRGVLEHRRAGARRAMVRELRGPRLLALSAGWSDLLMALPVLGPAGRPDAERPIAAVAAERIAKVYRRMVKLGEAIDDESPAEDYHELRKQGKELRYLLELFGAPLFDAEVVKPMVKALKELQDVLGRHQDREVQAETVRGLADEVAVRPGGPAALMTMGTLVRALNADEHAARAQFATVFAAFASPERQRRVKKTFRSS